MVIIAAIGLTFAVTIALLGINEMLSGSGVERSDQILQKADGCVEEAYYRLKLNPSYTGGTIPYSDATCNVSVSGSGASKTITSTVSSGDYTRTITSDVDLKANTEATAKGIDLTDWEE